MVTTYTFERYNELKRTYPTLVLLVKSGDFYITYRDDAIVCGDVLGVTVTKGSGMVEMTMFPCVGCDTYLPRLIRAGYRVAIAD